MKCENYTYLPEQVGESSGGCSSVTPQSLPLKSNHTVKMCSEHASGTEYCQSSRSLETSKNLTDDRGEGQLTLFAEDFPARTSAQQGRGQESLVNAVACGRKWRELLERFGLDLRLLKIPRCLGPEDYQPSSKTWPRWGMTRDGECWELGTLVRRIKETECGYWPTPCTRDYKGTNAPEGLTRKDGKSRLDQLPNAVAYGGTQTQQKWPTPTQSEWKGRGPNSKQQGLTNQIACTGAQLNPSWVEWLMGWPIGWTELKPLETDKFRNVQQWHSAFFQRD